MRTTVVKPGDLSSKDLRASSYVKKEKKTYVITIVATYDKEPPGGMQKVLEDNAIRAIANRDILQHDDAELDSFNVQVAGE